MNDNPTSGLKRRDFLKLGAAAGLTLPLLSLPWEALAAPTDVTLRIMHTNDTHSRIDPFPVDGGRNAGAAGCARRKVLIDQLRQEQAVNLLVDAGDIFQGTPYFNLYQGKLEIELMNRMGYEACTLGNHDFDAGIPVLIQRIDEARFPFLNCNYTFSDSALKSRVKESIVLTKGGLKIGLYGVGINLDGLAPTGISGQVGYRNPVENARRVEAELKKKGCHMIICLSHLGLFPRAQGALVDRDLAAKTDHTDLVIGGHTHTFLDEPEKHRNARGVEVLVNQVGWAGIRLGQLDYRFKAGTATQRTSQSVPVK